MAGIYKRGGVWWGRAQRGGKEFRQSLKTRSEKDARKRLAEWVKALEAAEWGERPRLTLNAVAERFIQGHLPNIRYQAARRYGVSLQWLDQRMGHKILDEITSADLVDFETWRRSMGVSAPTIRRDLACLASLFSFAIEREFVDASPVSAFLKRAKRRGLVESAPRTRYLTKTEEAALLAECKAPNLAYAVKLAIWTGLRQQELFSLTWNDIDMPAREIVTRAETAKGGKVRRVVILPEAAEVLKSLPRHIRSPYVLWHGYGRPFKDRNNAFERVVTRAGVNGLVWHDLRRTHGCRLLQDFGWSMEMVRDQLGHASVVITERTYAFLEVDQRKKRAGNCAADDPAVNERPLTAATGTKQKPGDKT